jgi:hypothetical protein
VPALCVLVALAIVAGADLMAAPKPPPAQVDTGTIYYREYSLDVWSMKPEGSGKTKLSVKGVPSQALHDGKRWFLTMEAVSGTYPDGYDRHELFATREDGQISVQITDSTWVDADGNSMLVEFDNQDGYFLDRFWTFGWAADSGAADGKVYFPGWTWDVTTSGSETVTGFGYYVAYLSADDWTDICADSSDWTPATPALLDDVPVAIYPEPAEGDSPGCLNTPCDWSPDGEQIVYAPCPGTVRDLWVATPGLADAAKVYSNGTLPSWSSADRIAFTTSGAGYWKIVSIKPDGSAATTLATLTNKNWTQNKRIVQPRWSPNATYLAYIWADFSGTFPYPMDIYRITSSGSGATNLTSDQTTDILDLIWRP